MKTKLLSLLLALLLLVSLTACGGGDSAEAPAAPAEDEQPEVETQDPEAEAPAPEATQDEAAYEISHVGNRLYTNSIGTTWSQTIIAIENTGTKNLYLSSGAYDLEDANGALVAAQSYVSAFPDVLQPGEKGWLYEETTIENVSPDAALTVLPRENVDEAKVECIRLPVTDFALSDDELFGLKALGRVENNTGDDIEGMLYIAAGLYDEAGAPIAVLFTILPDPLPAGEKIGFELTGFALPEDITTANVADYVVYAYPLQMQF